MNELKKILVLDDDPDIGFMLKTMLEYKGYAVTTIDNGNDLAAAMAASQFDLLIVDMLLSGANGIDICIMLKADPQTASLPVILSSAHPNLVQEAARAGSDDYIHKPFEMQDMLGKIKRLLEAKA